MKTAHKKFIANLHKDPEFKIAMNKIKEIRDRFIEYNVFGAEIERDELKKGKAMEIVESVNRKFKKHLTLNTYKHDSTLHERLAADPESGVHADSGSDRGGEDPQAEE